MAPSVLANSMWSSLQYGWPLIGQFRSHVVSTSKASCHLLGFTSAFSLVGLLHSYLASCMASFLVH